MGVLQTTIDADCSNVTARPETELLEALEVD
jgi:hypothetical protein